MGSLKLTMLPASTATAPRILLVDDQPAILHSLVRMLPCRVDCVIVNSAVRAQRELERGPFDLVVSDLKMPGMLGSQLLKIVAKRWPATRRMLLTGYTDGELLESGSLYADEVCDKILDWSIITRKICALAENPR